MSIYRLFLFFNYSEIKRDMKMNLHGNAYLHGNVRYHCALTLIFYFWSNQVFLYITFLWLVDVWFSYYSLCLFSVSDILCVPVFVFFSCLLLSLFWSRQYFRRVCKGTGLARDTHTNSTSHTQYFIVLKAHVDTSFPTTDLADQCVFGESRDFPLVNTDAGKHRLSAFL